MTSRRASPVRFVRDRILFARSRPSGCGLGGVSGWDDEGLEKMGGGREGVEGEGRGKERRAYEVVPQLGSRSIYFRICRLRYMCLLLCRPCIAFGGRIL